MTDTAVEESNLVKHARKELELAGLFSEDSDYDGMIGLMLHVGPDEVNLQELAEWLLSYNVHLEEVTFRGGHFKWERPERRDEYNDRQQREAHYEAEMEASARRQYEKLKERFEPKPTEVKALETTYVATEDRVMVSDRCSCPRGSVGLHYSTCSDN